MPLASRLFSRTDLRLCAIQPPHKPYASHFSVSSARSRGAALSVFARPPLRLTERYLVDHRPLSCPYGAPCAPLPLLYRALTECPAPFPPLSLCALTERFVSRDPFFVLDSECVTSEDPFVFRRLNFYLPYSIARSRVFRNAVLVLFLLIVIELTRGLHVCVI